MAELELKIHSNLTTLKYQDINKTKQDALVVLRFYRGLKPFQEQFTFINNLTKTLFALKGTIPIQYKGTIYNIPICIWLRESHPHHPPIIYVKPVYPNMKIRVSHRVDKCGKVNLPYMKEWSYENSYLLELIQMLISSFQEKPPVYAVVAPIESVSDRPIQMPVVASGLPYYPIATQNYLGLVVSLPKPNIASLPLTTGLPTPVPNAPIPVQPFIQLETPSFSKRQSLISAVEEKLRKRLEELYMSTEIERKTGAEFKAGGNKLEQMMKKMDKENKTLVTNMEIGQTDGFQLDYKIAEMQKMVDDLDIDGVVQVPTPLYRQIVKLWAEDTAMTDTIYNLRLGYEKNAIKVQQFLKHLRHFGRKKFLIQLLIKKCRNTAGLAG